MLSSWKSSSANVVAASPHPSPRKHRPTRDTSRDSRCDSSLGIEDGSRSALASDDSKSLASRIVGRGRGSGCSSASAIAETRSKSRLSRSRLATRSHAGAFVSSAWSQQRALTATRGTDGERRPTKRGKAWWLDARTRTAPTGSITADVASVSVAAGTRSREVRSTTSCPIWARGRRVGRLTASTTTAITNPRTAVGRLGSSSEPIAAARKDTL
jgi:hypothetical protein